ncbi:MAG: hypothetical protein EZS28_002082 [Streblomastix strix]|uniref:Uncharacterized protein n=1 Tax=Streblomastix strix TaxID=222440 RepID=A0A5J4X6L2_9EUKA|nr:MAG: hypothetical protein EZS28_002082 [Streblomastix strix]
MGQMIIEPNDDIRNQGLRLMKNKANWDSFVLSGCNIDPQDRDGLIAPLPIPPIENAIKQTIAYDEAKPQFTGTPFNIPLNAVMFAQKVIGYPICWNGAIPIDYCIDVDGH